MYANSAPQARTEKPCDGARHNYFHNNDGLMRHQIEIGVRLQPELVQKPLYDAQKERELELKKRKGSMPCRGKLYHVYHTEQKQHHSDNTSNHSLSRNTLETRVDSYSQESAQQHAHANKEQASYAHANYLNHSDMRSVEEAIYHMLKSGEYVRHMKPTEHAAQAIYHRVKSDVSEKRYSIENDVAAKVEEKYGRKYEVQETKLYKGSEVKVKKDARKTEKDSEIVREIKKESKIEEKKPQSAARSTKKTVKAKAKEKKRAKKKAVAGKSIIKKAKKAVSRNSK